MSELIVELCPETGMCSILKEGAGKVDLMPDEASAIKVSDDAQGIRAVIAEVDPAFAQALDADDMTAITDKLS